MKSSRICLLVALLLLPFAAKAQQETFEVDYNNPKKFIVGGVTVEGNHYFSEPQIVQLSGLQEGMDVTVPGEEFSSIVNRLWQQKFFENIEVRIDSLVPATDTAFFKIVIQERPRVSRWTFTGVRKGEQKELMDRLHLRRGGEFSDYVAEASTGVIKRFYNEKAFLKTDVDIQVQEDTVIKNAIRVNFDVNKGNKIKIKTINFSGNDDVSDFKLAKSMKKTKSAKYYNFFSSKKFNEKEYPNDKKGLISAMNEAGFRDARILRDSIYYLPPKHPGDSANKLGIDFELEQGDRYYFRNITWTGNSVYSTDVLNQILAINPGDVYDVVTMQKRLMGGGKQSDYDVSKLYRDNGYLFFNITPVELNIQNDSVDVEMRISEGKPATLNNIVINGNDLTNERVVRRQIFTRPGYLFSQSDFERSVREIASLGQFDPEAIMDPSTGYSIIPNQLNNTVDLIYNVTEKPSSQLELSGGWGGRTFVATVGVSFNNFSTSRILDKSAWRPVPLGDAQNLAFRFQTNGTYYTALTASFTEPWLFGKKPTSLNLSAYYTRQTDSYLYLNILSHDRQMEIYGFAASLGNRLKWPDSYFILYNGLSWQSYKLKNWYDNYFIFDDGLAHNISYSLSLTRNSTDQQIYPRQGQDFSASVQLTPPFSLLRKKDYGNLDAEGNPTKVSSYKDINYNRWDVNSRYKWIEYHKWKFSETLYTKLIGDLVLMTRAQFGYLGYYNRNWGYSPFEGFLVGGDGMSGYSTYGSEIVALRGYQNYSLTPYVASTYNSNGYAYAGNVYDKFTVELRYPVILQPQSTIFVLAFLEGGNCWADIRDFNPFQIKRSAGVGVRIFLPMVGLLGVDWGYGFDDATNGKSQFHFVIGQQF
ncbi:MAG: outer membrane protein assembly factor BamA [Bacteroidales bacterium]|nr:outer membrane protein assembly factor BamA [Candidatus Cryptobacteroides onthequi]MCQ2164542.1 outer membrane protein assembly factor BamA [Bacteroidales bacterium]